MAVAAVGVVGAIATSAATTTAGAVAASVAVTAAGVLAAYVDQQYVYPALFGKKDPKPGALEGFQLSTTDPGAARWDVFGSRAWVPCHYLWNENIRNEIEGGGGGGKGGGGRPRYNVLKSTVGIGVANGPVAEIDTLYADEQFFWSTQFNRVFLEDSRWFLDEDGTSGRLNVIASDRTNIDFTSVFEVGNALRLENASPEGLNGLYTVFFVQPHGGAGGVASMSLTPIEGQSVAALTPGTAGNAFSPAILRRIDDGYVGEELAAPGLGGPGPLIYGNSSTEFSVVFNENAFSSALDGILERFIVGQNYFINYTGLGAEAPSTIPQGRGVWKLEEVQASATFSDTTGSVTVALGPRFKFSVVGLDAGAEVVNPANFAGISATTPVVITRSEVGGFVHYDEEQEFEIRLGTSTQSAPTSITDTRPDSSALRGLACVGLKNWNLGPHGNVFPRTTALVRASLGETIGEGVKRICGRTMGEDDSDVTGLPDRPLHGFSIPGGLPSSQALQPLNIYYGLHIQDRGGVLTFLDERDLPVISVPTRHLNAQPDGAARDTVGFQAERRDKDDIPERVVLHYIGMQEGSNLAEGVGTRSPNSPDRSQKDTLDIQLRPLVAPGYEVKQRAREILRRIKLEAYSGQVTLPPSYLDVMPSTVLSFASHDGNSENAVAAAGVLSHSCEVRDLVEGTIELEVVFADGQTAKLTDSNGAFVGFPDTVTTITTNSIDYVTGAVALDTTPALDDAFPVKLSYRYERDWLMRVGQSTLSGFDMSTACDIVQTTTEEPMPPVRRDVVGSVYTPVQGSRPNDYVARVLDIPMLRDAFPEVRIGFAACPVLGASWAGATVYESPNGVDRWRPVATIEQPTLIAKAQNVLPTGATPGEIDWRTSMLVEFRQNDPELLTQTIEGLSQGRNWALIGDEIVAFHEVQLLGNQFAVLYGIIRGLRGTALAMDSHALEEDVIFLEGFEEGQHGASYEPAGGFAAVPRTYHHRIVPGNLSVDTVTTITTQIRGRSALPQRPVFRSDMVTVNAGSNVTVTWGRRSPNQTSVFGAARTTPGEHEYYEVFVFDVAQAAALGGTEADVVSATKRIFQVGDPNMNTPVVKREVVYDNATIAADGFTIDTDTIGFYVKQVNAAGASDRSDLRTAVALS